MRYDGVKQSTRCMTPPMGHVQRTNSKRILLLQATLQMPSFGVTTTAAAVEWTYPPAQWNDELQQRPFLDEPAKALRKEYKYFQFERPLGKLMPSSQSEETEEDFSGSIVQHPKRKTIEGNIRIFWLILIWEEIMLNNRVKYPAHLDTGIKWIRWIFTISSSFFSWSELQTANDVFWFDWTNDVDERRFPIPD